MDRQQILTLIQRLAKENGGKPPGREAFERKTGIKNWYPHMWKRWNDAVREAGFAPNELQGRMSDHFVIEKYIALTRELGTVPVAGDLRVKAKQDSEFPAHTVFQRYGGKEKLLDAVEDYCRSRKGYSDILALCEARASTPALRDHRVKVETGFVYLMKMGRKYYKIGFTNSVGRRGGELSIQLPVRPSTIHSIETDDPRGIEHYWHERFAEKRHGKNNERFDLTPEDVRAFKRWKKIV